MVNIEQLRADVERFREAADVANKALQNAEIALAEALCPFKVGQTINAIIRTRETKAIVSAIHTGWQGSRHNSYYWELSLIPIKKDGTKGISVRLSWAENQRMLKINGISEEYHDVD